MLVGPPKWLLATIPPAGCQDDNESQQERRRRMSSSSRTHITMYSKHLYIYALAAPDIVSPKFWWGSFLSWNLARAFLVVLNVAVAMSNYNHLSEISYMYSFEVGDLVLVSSVTGVSLLSGFRFVSFLKSCPSLFDTSTRNHKKEEYHYRHEHLYLSIRSICISIPLKLRILCRSQVLVGCLCCRGFGSFLFLNNLARAFLVVVRWQGSMLW